MPLAGYRKRIALTATGGASGAAGTLTDFPGLIPGSLLPAGAWSSIRPDGGDLAVTSSDGQTRLPAELVWIEHGQGFELRPLCPVMAPGELFYLYYDNPDASQPAVSDPFGRDAVWSNGEVGVWHLQQNPAGPPPQAIDATGRGHDGTTQGSMTAGDLVDAQIGKGYRFDGIDDCLAVPDHADLRFAGTSFGLGAWVSTADSAIDQRIGGKQDASGGFGFYGLRINAGKFGFFLREALGSSTGWVYGSTSIASGTRYRVWLDVDRSANTATLYVNGQPEATADLTGISQITPDGDLRIGNNFASYLVGVVDEFAVAGVARSADWCLTEYRMHADPAGFWSVGAPETLAPTTRKLIIPPGATLTIPANTRIHAAAV